MNKIIPEFDSGPSNWARKNLESLHEQPLKVLVNSPCSVVYRFLWLRSFHNPVSIRVEHYNDGGTRVFARELDNRGNKNPKSLLKNLQYEWSADQYRHFIDKIEAMHFWSRHSIMTIKLSQLATDGAIWVIEGADRNNYHFVVRGAATISTDSQLKEVGLFLLEETNLLPPSEEIY